MIFNSIQFIWTLPAIFIIYYLVVLNFSAKQSLRFGNMLLVIISYCLFCNGILNMDYGAVKYSKIINKI